MTPYFGFSYQRASAKALTSFLINEMSSRRASYAVHYAYTFHYRYIRYLFTIQNTRWDDIPHISYRFFLRVEAACSSLSIILLLEACTRIELVSWEWNSHILFQLDEHAIIGVPKRTWTADPTIKRRMLYQLSYWHIYVQFYKYQLHIWRRLGWKSKQVIKFICEMFYYIIVIIDSKCETKIQIIFFYLSFLYIFLKPLNL